MKPPSTDSGSSTAYITVVILLNHWGAVLPDNFDPLIVDGLANRHRVIDTD